MLNDKISELLQKSQRYVTATEYRALVDRVVLFSIHKLTDHKQLQNWGADHRKTINDVDGSHGIDIDNDRPIRLTQCCTQFKPFGNKTFCFRNFHII